MHPTFTDRNLSHQSLTKALAEALTANIPGARRLEAVGVEKQLEPDLVLKLDHQRVLVDATTSSQPSRILRAVFEVLGYLALTPSEKAFVLLVVPASPALEKPLSEALTKAVDESGHRLGFLGFEVSGSTIQFHRLAGEVSFLPDVIQSQLSRSYTPSRGLASLASPMSMRVVRHLLVKEKTTQSRTSLETRVSLGQVNKVVTYLRERGMAEYRGKTLVLPDPVQVLNQLSWARRMESLKIRQFNASDSVRTVEDIEQALAQLCQRKGAAYAYTLFSAARRHSPYLRKADVIQLYVDPSNVPSPQFLENLIQRSESKTHIEYYAPDSPDIFQDATDVNGAMTCSKIQTVIDLYCLGRPGYDAAIELYAKIRTGGT